MTLLYGLAKKKLTSISDRSRAWTEQIAARLEAEIKRLDSHLQHVPTPRLRSTLAHSARRHGPPARTSPLHRRPP